MRLTDAQADAVRFIANNPGTTVSEIASAGGASQDDAMEFLRALIDSGLAQVAVTSEIDAMMDDWQL